MPKMKRMHVHDAVVSVVLNTHLLFSVVGGLFGAKPVQMPGFISMFIYAVWTEYRCVAFNLKSITLKYLFTIWEFKIFKGLYNWILESSCPSGKTILIYIRKIL